MSGDTKKILFRIGYVILAAAVITAGAVFLGNHLTEKVKEVDDNISENEVQTGISTERETAVNKLYEDYSPVVMSVSVDLTDYLSVPDAEEGEDAPSLSSDIALYAESYDTLTFPLTDGDGRLIYESAAMSEMTRTQYDENDEILLLLQNALALAEESSLRTCAVITPLLGTLSVTNASTVDAAVLRELGEFGFDEVLFDFTEVIGSSLSTEEAGRVRTYLQECATLSDHAVKLGVLLTDSVYLDSSAAKEIEAVADAASFLGITFDLTGQFYTDGVYTFIAEKVSSLLGKFGAYRMRVFMDSPYEIITASAYSACVAHGVNSMAFGSYVSPDALAEALPDEEPEPEPVSTEETTNPYMTTKDNPSIGASDFTEDSTAAIETDESTEPESSDTPRPWY